MAEFSDAAPALKLAACQEQLAQIEAYLTSDQSNPEWLKLKRDIEHVIKMTEALIEVQQNKPEGEESSQATAATPAVEVETFQALTSVEVGDHVEVIGDRPYAGIVTSVSSDMTECTLKYYEVGKEVTLPLTSMRALIGKNCLSADQVGPGLKCQCKYACDRKWYDVVVDELTPHGYNVTYAKFGNKEEVPLEYLRETPLAALKGSEKNETSGFVIPENLKILPTDTEEEKLKKKKRIKGMKSRNRLDNIDKERSAIQNSWKAFTTKTTKMSKKSGGVPHVKKRSMFASPEVVEGRVGVTRSGLGMTQIEDRKRYKLNGPS